MRYLRKAAAAVVLGLLWAGSALGAEAPPDSRHVQVLALGVGAAGVVATSPKPILLPSPPSPQAPPSSAPVRDGLCPQLYLDGRQPAPLPAMGVELCNDNYAVVWDPRTRNPAYASEVLSSRDLRLPDKVRRTDDFRPDHRLQPSDRAELDDYVGHRPYDRGHMAPAADATSPRGMSQTFLLSNMVPQVRENNRGEWARVEEAVRSMVVPVYEGRGWVVTGPLYDHGTQLKLDGRVAVPDALFKAFYVPGDAYGNPTSAGVLVSRNAVDAHLELLSLDRFRDLYGVRPFGADQDSTLPADVRSSAAVPGAVRRALGL